MLLDTRKKQNKFIISMIIIIACATLINYSIFGLLSTYHFTKGSIDENILLMVIIIGITSLLMFILIPKETTENMMKILDDNGGAGIDYEEKTPDEQLKDMIDGDSNDLKI